jgi:hypothetical protein
MELEFVWLFIVEMLFCQLSPREDELEMFLPQLVEKLMFCPTP